MKIYLALVLVIAGLVVAQNSSAACVTVDMLNPRSEFDQETASRGLKFDATKGAILSVSKGESKDGGSWHSHAGEKDETHFVVPLTVDGKDNRNFDRMYALLMKGLESKLEVCSAAAEIKRGETHVITLIEINPSTGPKKVQICDADATKGCVRIYDNKLRTTN